MFRDDFHLSDQDLLLAADGELPAYRAARVRSHLAVCQDCRARMAELEGTILDFARIHRQMFDPQLPPIAGLRSSLRAQLAKLTDEGWAGSWAQRFFLLTADTRTRAYIYIAFCITVAFCGFLFQHATSPGTESAVAPVERGLVPDRNLTPGATRPVAIGDVCSVAHEEVVRTVPISLRQEVFREYRIVNARVDDYEIDYLIAPQLGGTGDIRNLWPEPDTSPTWNAHVKDALEERLHQLVCSGQLDLSTAQRDIATDWIAAYKKYFNTETSLSVPTDLIQVRSRFNLFRRWHQIIGHFGSPQVTPA